MALQRAYGNRAVQRMLPARPSGALLQRFPAAPADVDLDKWHAYLDDVSKALALYIKDNDVQHLEVKDFTEVQGRLDEIDQALTQAKNAVGGQRSDASLKSKVAAAGKLFGPLGKAIKDAKLATENRLKPPKVAPVVPYGDEIRKAITLYKVDPEAVLARLGAVITEPKLTPFAKVLHLTLTEVYVGGVAAGLVDFGTANTQLTKLTTADSGTFTGVLAEFQGVGKLLAAGELDVTRPAFMGLDMPRPLPFRTAKTTQDVDISYTSSAGVTQLIEVKDSVATLETKMNDIVGATDALEIAQKFESRQALSLAKLRDTEQAKGLKVELKIMCLYPFGWVRFVMSRNCDKLIDHNITLVIAGKEFPPGRLRALRDALTRELEQLDRDWGAKSVDKNLPKRTVGPAGNRHEAHWRYEELHPDPPQI